MDAIQGDDETTLGLLKVRVPGGKDVGWSQVRAGCSEEIAHAVAATIRIKFMQDEELEFVSHQASSFAFAHAVFLQQKNKESALQVFDRYFFGEEETTPTPPKKTLLQIYNDNPELDEHELERARPWIQKNVYALQERHLRALWDALCFLSQFLTRKTMATLKELHRGSPRPKDILDEIQRRLKRQGVNTSFTLKRATDVRPQKAEPNEEGEAVHKQANDVRQEAEPGGEATMKQATGVRLQKAEPDGGGEAGKKKEETADFRGSQELAHFTAPTGTDGAPEVCKCEAGPEGGEATKKEKETEDFRGSQKVAHFTVPTRNDGASEVYKCETLPEVPHHTSSKQAMHTASVSTQQEQQYVTQASVDVREVEVDADVRIQRPHPHADDVGGPITDEIQGRTVNMGCSDWGGIFSSLIVLLLTTTLYCSRAEVKVNASLDEQMIAQGEQSMFQNTSSAFMFSPPSSSEDGGVNQQELPLLGIDVVHIIVCFLLLAFGYVGRAMLLPSWILATLSGTISKGTSHISGIKYTLCFLSRYFGYALSPLPTDERDNRHYPPWLHGFFLPSTLGGTRFLDSLRW